MSVVGVDVGGTFVKAVRLDPNRDVVARALEPTPDVPSAILDVVASVATQLGPGLPLGLGLAGLVDHEAGQLVWAPHLPGTAVGFRDPLRARLGVPVTVDNDANMAALAEHRLGAGQGADHMLMITLGTGIGMGAILGGRVYRGRGHAGEVGHITIDTNGDHCACGRKGCWETKVSGSRFGADARELLGADTRAEDLVEAALGGDSKAIERITEAGEWLAVGLETLVLVFDPDVIVIGGAAAGAGDLLLDPVRRRLSVTEGAGHRPLAKIVPSVLGPEAGAIGAAIAAMEETR